MTQEYICTKSVLAAEIYIFYKPPLPLNIYIYVLKNVIKFTESTSNNFAKSDM